MSTPTTDFARSPTIYSQRTQWAASGEVEKEEAITAVRLATGRLQHYFHIRPTKPHDGRNKFTTVTKHSTNGINVEDVGGRVPHPTLHTPCSLTALQALLPFSVKGGAGQNMFPCYLASYYALILRRDNLPVSWPLPFPFSITSPTADRPSHFTSYIRTTRFSRTAPIRQLRCLSIFSPTLKVSHSSSSKLYYTLGNIADPSL